jgi:citrate synthase
MKDQEQREQFHWRSAISYKTIDRIVVRGYNINELTGSLDLGEMVYLTWMGELPTKAQGKMLNALLVSTLEHAFSPSTVATRFAASGRVELQAAVASGILAFGDVHGGAHISAKQWQHYVKRMREENKTVEEIAKGLLTENQVVLGFHHPQHINGDPRPPRLLDLAKEYGVYGDHCNLAQTTERLFPEIRKQSFKLNQPGCVGAIASDLGFPWDLVKAITFCARAFGCVAHAREEVEREKGWRASTTVQVIQPLDLELQGPKYYDGPKDRVFPKNRT